MRSRRVDSCLMRKRCNENNSLWKLRKLCCWRKLVGGKSLGCFGWRKGIIQSSSIVLWTHTVEHYWAFSGRSDRDQTIEFYQHLYTEAGVWRPLLDGMPFSAVDDEESSWLDNCFTKDVFEAVKNMSGDKALGSDEFMMAFFKACWSILKWTWYIWEE